MRSPRAAALALAMLTATGALWWTFARSGIPHALQGRVEGVEVRSQKHAGVDDVHLVTIRGRTLHLDAEVAAHLPPGELVSKDGWSTELRYHLGTVRLRPSRDFFGMLVAMPLAIAVAAGSLWIGRRLPV